MKNKKIKEIKYKFKLSSLVALTSASVLTNELNDFDELIKFDTPTPHVAYVSENNKQVGKLGINYLLKIALLVPLWLLGSFILKLLEPLKSFILTFVITFIILCLLVYVIAKWLFPNLKFKDIFTIKNLIIIAVFSLLITISKYVLLLLDKDFLKYSLMVYFFLGLSCLIIVLLPLIKLARRINKIYKAIP